MNSPNGAKVEDPCGDCQGPGAVWHSGTMSFAQAQKVSMGYLGITEMLEKFGDQP